MAVNLGSAEGSLDLDISGFASELNNAVSKTSKAVSDIESEADGLGDGLAKAGKEGGEKLGDGVDKGSKKSKESLGVLETAIDKVKGVAGGLVAAFGFGALVSGIQSAVDVANEFQEDMGKLSTQASATNTSIEDANNAYRNMVGILGETDQSVEATNTLLALTQGNTERLSEANEYLAGVYARWGDSLPLEGLTEAMNETAAAGQVVGPFADALNWARDRTDALAASLSGNAEAQAAFNQAKADGLQNEDAFNAALATTTDEQERATMIMDAMNAMYSETGQTYLETNADLVAYRQSQSDLNAAISELGTVFMPVTTAVSSFGAGLMNEAAPAIQQVLQDAQPFGETLMSMGDTLTSLVVPAFTFLYDNLNTIGPVLLGVVTAITAYNVISNAMTVATTLATAAQNLLNTVMKANPIMVIVSLIAGLVVALVGLYNTNETVRNVIDTVWNTISSTVGGVVSALVNFFTVDVPNAINGMVSFFTSIPGNVQNALASALASVASFVIQLAADAVSAGQGFLEGISNGFNSVVDFVASIPSRILEALGDLGGLLWNAGSQIIDGLLGGLKSAWDGVTGWFGDITSAIPNLKGPPSKDKKLLRGNGELIIGGLLSGFIDEWKEIEKFFKSKTDSIGSKFSDVYQSIAYDTPSYVQRSPFGLTPAAAGAGPSVPAGSSGGDTYVFYSPEPINEVEAARQMKKAKRDLADGFD